MLLLLRLIAILDNWSCHFQENWPNHDNYTIPNGEWCVQLKHLKDKWVYCKLTDNLSGLLEPSLLGGTSKFDFIVTGMWTGEESCINGIHNSWIRRVSYSGIFGRMGNRKFWGLFFQLCLKDVVLSLDSRAFLLIFIIFIFHVDCRKFPLLLFPKPQKFLLMVVGLVYIVILICWWKHYGAWDDGSVWFICLFK